jgi:hypothetical protein
MINRELETDRLFVPGMFEISMFRSRLLPFLNYHQATPGAFNIGRRDIYASKYSLLR